MDVVILTGMSGAGKSQAANYLEDMGYFCIDNLPPNLLPELVRSFARKTPSASGQPAETTRLAMVVDVRSSELFDELIPSVRKLDDMNISYRVIFLDAADQELIGRYKQSRRNHPLAKETGIAQAIAMERQKLSPIREQADDIIDTTNINLVELREMLYAMLGNKDHDERMTILVQSFGFKYGIPLDCDCVLDVRFIPNPYYIKELKLLSGLDRSVREYVMSFAETKKYLAMQVELFDFIIPYYIREGKVRLTIGIGCTGGRHRSVTLASELAAELEKNNLRVVIDHRDLDKDTRHKRRYDGTAGETKENGPI